MIQILDATAENEIQTLETEKLRKKISDPMDREIHSWNAPWRAESLRHYLSSGWSVGLRDDNGGLKAYFLAQPILYFKGLTQVLWVEYFSYDNQEELGVLLDTVSRYAKEKHLQSVFYLDAKGDEIEIRTTKR